MLTLLIGPKNSLVLIGSFVFITTTWDDKNYIIFVIVVIVFYNIVEKIKML